MEQAKSLDLKHKTGTIVRVGNQQWVVGADQELEPGISTEKVITLSTFEENRQLASGRIRRHALRTMETRAHQAPSWLERVKSHPSVKLMIQYIVRMAKTYLRAIHLPARYQSIRESFQGGLIFGLVLGCLCLFLFHQVHPRLLSSSMNVQMGDVFASQEVTQSIAVPGIQLYAISLGDFSSRSAALDQQQVLLKRGVKSTVLQLTSYVLTQQVAVDPIDLQGSLRALRKAGISASLVPLNIHSRNLPVLPTMPSSAIYAMNQWLSAETSAVVTLVTTVSDHGRFEDASTALHYANQVYPGDTSLAQTGLSLQLSTFRRILASAYLAFGQHQNSIVMSDLVRAVDALSTTQGVSQ